MPKGAFEQILVEKIVADAWRLRRIRLLEAALYHRQERAAKLDVASRRQSAFEKNIFTP